jgi:predicted MFS family arabinose efflux permease
MDSKIVNTDVKVNKGWFANFASILKTDRDFKLFIIAGFFIGIATGINSTVFNNYLSDSYSLSASARGFMEFPRELPGMLIMLILGLLSFLGDIRVVFIGMICAAIGMFGIGMLSPSYSIMLLWLMTYSLGTHIYMTLSPSIGMALSDKQNYGKRLGKFSAYNLVASIIGYAIVWLGFKYLGFNYKIVFGIASVSFIIAAIILRLMKSNQPKEKKFKLLVRKQYSLYYILSVINGARKQIFLTFAPWVLIQVYHLDAPSFALLGLTVSVLSIATRTIIGNAIDKKGERFVLSLGSVVVIIICIGYSVAGDIFSAGTAVVVLSACYVLDNSMSVVDMARSTYVKKIAIHPEDVSLTLSAGMSFDHVAAMCVPFLGGLVWTAFGYKYVFIIAVLIGIVNLIYCMKIKVEEQ